ncbi:transglycosylase domain-containing protein [Rubeoparvulum massiliense]|uniref:transglycosylase domain-containing protein n=1 Tax=Rubeoparvulum massiliense TaxID=1631346 RepID=UPI00069D25C1|nr:transglycosylase domain-containing protein [Rubeoparvulum massiliense]
MVKVEWGRRIRRGVAVILILSILLFCSMSTIGGMLVDYDRLAQYETAMKVAQREGTSHLDHRIYVDMEQMPLYISDAFVAIEDHRYDLHPGVDLVGLGRAIWQDVRQGSLVQGGSTITMQLARNLFLNQDKEFDRKLKEMAIAIYLEQSYTKEELLEMYLNTIYFGHGIYGIETAANFYFDKTVQLNHPTKETISLSEAAMLAALPKAPEHYSPIKDFAKAKQRQQVVLERMEQLGYLTEEEKNAAIHTNINIPLAKGTVMKEPPSLFIAQQEQFRIQPIHSLTN